MPLQVHLSDLEQALHHLLQELRQKKGEVIEIDPIDYYWSIPREELYDPYRDPTQRKRNRRNNAFRKCSPD